MSVVTKKKGVSRFMARKPMSLTATQLYFSKSKILKSPIPDRYFCWVSAQQSGLGPSVTASTTFSFGLNIPEFPFAHDGGGSLIQSPTPAVATNNGYGFHNLLFNGTTNTGLWINYRVWSTSVKITATPILSTVQYKQLVMAPVLGTFQYSSYNNACLSPHSCQTIATASEPGVLHKVYSIPEIMGIPKEEYSALSTQTYGIAGTTPSTQVILQYVDFDANTTHSQIEYRIELQFHIEFFQNGLATFLTS